MSAEEITDNAATVIIGNRLRPGCDKAFLAWEHDLNRAASQYPGFMAAEVKPPTASEPEWTTIYRFDTLANLQAWLNSGTRQDRLPEGRHYLASPPTQQVIHGAAKAPDELVTVVVTHRVDPDNVQEFLGWQERMRDAEGKFPGYRGSELFRPIAGVQDEWTAMYRYDTAADLDVWLRSPERERLLAEGKNFKDFQLRTVDSSFGSWFAFDDDGSGAPPASEFKTSIAVWAGLYPIVMLLSLALRPLAMPLWLNLLLGNLLSSILITFVGMPYYVNPLLGRWIRLPAGAEKRRENLRGIALIVVLMSAWAAFFYAVTKVIWNLP
jgi:antibiotic biosynthesis monooxygenase (ABM) superfamily enzyme